MFTQFLCLHSVLSSRDKRRDAPPTLPPPPPPPPTPAITVWPCFLRIIQMAAFLFSLFMTDYLQLEWLFLMPCSSESSKFKATWYAFDDITFPPSSFTLLLRCSGSEWEAVVFASYEFLIFRSRRPPTSLAWVLWWLLKFSFIIFAIHFITVFFTGI